MRVLLITDTHNPDGGGTEKYFFTLKNKLEKAGVEIYSLGFGYQPQHTENSIVLQETPSKFWRQWWRMFFNRKKFREISDAIAAIKPDIIHLHNVKKYTVSLLKALQRYPVVQTVHDYSPLCPSGWNLHQNKQPCPTGLQLKCLLQHRRNYNFVAYAGLLISFLRMNYLLKKTVSKFIAPSPMLEHYLRLNEFGATIYLPPFQESFVTESREMLANHFLYVGQLELQKGVDVLVDEFANAVKRNNKLILKIAGTGSQETFLRQKIAELNLQENIIFLGWTRPQEYYQECVGLIFCSIGLESFGMVITEAMSAGRAVIGSNRGPTQWLVEDGQSGLLFDPLKSGDLAEKILWMADHVAEAKQFGRAGRERMDTFLSDENIINNILNVYEAAQN